MCAEYKIDQHLETEILAALDREYGDWGGPAFTIDAGAESIARCQAPRDFASRIKLFSEAPIVTGEDFEIRPMRFSLKPPSVKFATFNARLYDYDSKTDQIGTIAEKRTWRKPLAESRCLVPMSAFVEPIYTGAHAGEMVEFRDKNAEMLFAAGIFETSIDFKTGAPYTGFSIIMDQPNDFIRRTGHHRQPVFLKPTVFKEWLSSDLEVSEAMKLLTLQAQTLDLKVETDRKMAKGWEKRIAAFVEKSEKEIHFEEILRQKRFGESKSTFHAEA